MTLASVETPAQAAPPPAPKPIQLAAAVDQRGMVETAKSKGKPVVMLDPGHGGVDPGTIGLSGEYEKDIVLPLALAVKTALDKGGKVKCLMTRSDDTFIPLQERVAIARAAHADLFMSLHADSDPDPDIRGLSVYTLSKNASDATAQALADKENKSDLVAGLNLNNTNAEVTSILIDLVQRETLNSSAVFAGEVIDEVRHDTKALLENTHRFAGFAVLKAPDVPSVLVESGYLTNRQDEQLLRKPEYRAKLAAALARAIEGYFAQGHQKKTGLTRFAMAPIRAPGSRMAVAIALAAALLSPFQAAAGLSAKTINIRPCTIPRPTMKSPVPASSGAGGCLAKAAVPPKMSV